jgi:hypothetical protein
VKEVFAERVRAALPLRAERILRKVRDTRGGKMYDSSFEKRGHGEGPYAEAISALFAQMAQRYGLKVRLAPGMDEGTTFRRPRGQMGLFE